MADIYWITFRLEADTTHSKRHDALVEAIRLLTAKTWWTEPTSFIAFASEYDLDTITAKVKDAIDPKTDMALIRSGDVKSGRLIGLCQDADIMVLMPYVKKA